MNIKTTIAAVILGLTCLAFTQSITQNKTKSIEVITEKESLGATRYKENFNDYSYSIESIGTVSIDNVELNKGKLTALYSYKLGNEVRNVVSELNLDSDGVFKGTCTTKVNGQILFAVNTWLTFNQDGTAAGNWAWSGNPSNNDSLVKISKN